jgi:hypothetical protein
VLAQNAKRFKQDISISRLCSHFPGFACDFISQPTSRGQLGAKSNFFHENLKKNSFCKVETQKM